MSHKQETIINSFANTVRLG